MYYDFKKGDLVKFYKNTYPIPGTIYVEVPFDKEGFWHFAEREIYAKYGNGLGYEDGGTDWQKENLMVLDAISLGKGEYIIRVLSQTRILWIKNDFLKLVKKA